MTGPAQRDKAAGVHAIRFLLTRRGWPTAWLLAAVLAVRLLVPAGFMPVVVAGTVTIQPCSGFGPARMMAAMPGMDHGEHGKADQHGKEMPCGFGSLTAPALSGADPVLLLAALAYILSPAARPDALRTAEAPRRLRPPTRGPPRS